jgi:folate-dependent phosphoribosylglycinamide formyltransferase PurN
MSNITPFLQETSGRQARLGIFLSGSGSNAEKVLEQHRQAKGRSSYAPVVLITDAPETSRARELGRLYELPVVENDIRKFYRDRGQTRVTIATPEGQRLREAWTDALRSQLQSYQLDFGVLAGFVPLSNLVGDFPCLNVHPGDLSYLKDGQRYLIGLHTVPIERAILEGLDYLRSSVILAEPYSGQGDDMDSGPLLGISAPVSIDLQGASLEELSQINAERPAKRPRGGFGDRLEQLAQLNQEKLKQQGDWLVLPRVVADFASGNLGTDDHGKLCFRFGSKWQPIETVVHSRDGREVIFREAN